MPRLGAVAFPVVVIEGRLFEVWFDTQTKEIKVEERQQLRLHWRGSPSWPLRASIDVVVSEQVETFVRQRSIETDALLNHMANVGEQLSSCAKVQSLEAFKVESAPRGVIGAPQLLMEIRKLQEQNSAQLRQWPSK